MRQVMQRAAALGGHPPPRFEAPPWLVRGVGAMGSLSALLRGPDLGELVRASLGVTYWFSDAKARTELGYAPRPLTRDCAPCCRSRPAPRTRIWPLDCYTRARTR